MTKLTYDDPSISSGSSVNHFCVSLSNLTTLRLVAILCTLLVEGVKAEHVTTSTKDNIIIKEFILVLYRCFAITRGRRLNNVHCCSGKKRYLRPFLADIKSFDYYTSYDRLLTLRFYRAL